MYDQQSQSVNVNVPAQSARDDEFAQQMHAVVSEAAERVTFHRIETERWERIGSGAQAALNHLQQASPVAKMAPDGFLQDSSELMASPRY